jgi:hypothetical protein
MTNFFGCLAAIGIFIILAILRMAIYGCLVWAAGWMLNLFISDPLSLIGHKLTWFQCGALIGFITMFFRNNQSNKKD